MFGIALVVCVIAVAAANRGRSGALYCVWDNGAFATQHDIFGAAASFGLLRPICIFSQQERRFGAEHSALAEEENAQAKIGAGASPARLKTIANIKSLRIYIKSLPKLAALAA